VRCAARHVGEPRRRRELGTRPISCPGGRVDDDDLAAARLLPVAEHL
jgi:hypothetical protein